MAPCGSSDTCFSGEMCRYSFVLEPGGQAKNRNILCGPPGDSSPALENLLSEPVLHRNRILYRNFPGWPAESGNNRVVSLNITKHWVVAPVSPRELRLIPR